MKKLELNVEIASILKREFGSLLGGRGINLSESQRKIINEFIENLSEFILNRSSVVSADPEIIRTFLHRIILDKLEDLTLNKKLAKQLHNLFEQHYEQDENETFLNNYSKYRANLSD